MNLLKFLAVITVTVASSSNEPLLGLDFLNSSYDGELSVGSHDEDLAEWSVDSILPDRLCERTVRFKSDLCGHASSRLATWFPDCLFNPKDSHRWSFRISKIDQEFIPPRTWHIGNPLKGAPTGRIVEYDNQLGEYFYRPVWKWTGDVCQDYRHFLNDGMIPMLVHGIGVHAVLANTNLDENFRESVQRQAVRYPNDLRFASYFGETWLVVPTLAAIWFADGLVDRFGWLENHWHRDTGDWANQSLRALLVGVPVMGILQRVIGASRPGETAAGSRWRPFYDANGASGHAFIGAVPFLVAAKHAESRCLKVALIAGSVLPGYSRIYEDKHYLSQALLGWWISYLSVEATELTEQSTVQWRVVPLGIKDVVGIAWEYRR